MTALLWQKEVSAFFVLGENEKKVKYVGLTYRNSFFLDLVLFFSKSVSLPLKNENSFVAIVTTLYLLDSFWHCIVELY